ncbi:sulfate adenylyltransferase [Acanthamoeba castellanii str. Neff]|uniref:Sulfate adenylyltransferase n=1 Tax=Acanthamoeba castellanii (strain ATCC 30010 / Neff) TaxID=1257118 RepID=L8GUZ7_ACACF|nr:sulfate adenylyltransferase [Acanthamoeba castellanii str. Neff]ELR16825.1 sulfate adenylyltransferase [Acanthamoeba castellanii str. Neff]
MAATTAVVAQAPHGGRLCELIPDDQALVAELTQEAKMLKKLRLSQRQVCDLELLLNGGFSPLRGFLNKEDYDSVVDGMRLKSGLLWPMPVTLDVTAEKYRELAKGQRVALLDPKEGIPLAILTVESLWKPDKVKEAVQVFGANDQAHPAVWYLFNKAGDYYVGGSIEGIQLPPHYDFVELRQTPKEIRASMAAKSWSRMVAFQTRNPMHRSHKEITVLAARESGCNLLIHPVVGMTKPGDVDHYTRVRCYKEMMKHYPDGLASLSLLPLAMRMAGPREALWHAIIRKNYGATHFIVGRDHAGPGNNSKGELFYGVYDAQELVKKHQEELGVTIMDFRMEDQVPSGSQVLNISGTELRRRLYKGMDIPDWFSFPEVVKILRETYPPRVQQGFTLFFTGLSSSGKSTIAHALQSALLQRGGRTVSVLSGKKIRGLLSSELGFSRTDRDLNMRRIGYVASEITKSGGVAVLTAISPYEEGRRTCRDMVSRHGGFFEIYISTPLEVCEERDRKGLYAKARRGLITDFTGVNDPYEPPKSPEITIDASRVSVTNAVQTIIAALEEEGYLAQVKL